MEECLFSSRGGKSHTSDVLLDSGTTDKRFSSDAAWITFLKEKLSSSALSEGSAGSSVIEPLLFISTCKLPETNNRTVIYFH